MHKYLRSSGKESILILYLTDSDCFLINNHLEFLNEEFSSQESEKQEGISEQEFSVWSCHTWYRRILGELERPVPLEVVLKGTPVFWELSSRE